MGRLAKYKALIIIGAAAIGVFAALYFCDDPTRLYIGSIARQVF